MVFLPRPVAWATAAIPPCPVPLLHWLPRADEIVRSALETTMCTCVGGFRGWLLVSYHNHTSPTANVLVIYLRFLRLTLQLSAGGCLVQSRATDCSLRGK